MMYTKQDRPPVCVYKCVFPYLRRGSAGHTDVPQFVFRSSCVLLGFALFIVWKPNFYKSTSTAMSYRTVAMYVEIGCFVLCVSGWTLVCSTLPTEIWTWSEVSTIVLTASNYYSNLWKDCVSDSTGVSDCKIIPSMLALNPGIHLCRALIITAIILAFFGSILVLVGMKCTKIGGSEIANARITFAGGMNHLVGEFQDPNYKGQKYEIGVGVFIGWGGSTLLVVGGLIYSIFAGREACYSKSKRSPAYQFPDTYTIVPTQKSIATSVRTDISGSRKWRTSSYSRASSISEITSATKTSATNAYV
ncbi:claudin-10-like isoform X2 [Micropterus salmoides]|uniref:claudin-10-like isoform X2 n=1 Tax=Micropterus salmoides TaxID=27706 RepID=UPI0018EB920E|nr:claudin-10-like isoform X2 [Micropterus salmoides]